MKMSNKYFVCCEECFENIGKRSTAAARLWMDLCALDCQYGLTNLKGHDNPALRTLEMSGYVLTTDKPKHVCIQLRGRMETEDGQPFFCSKEGLHE